MKETKNKKGFTLVELLAVIAILAILVIMALPAVLRMYRQSRISSFQNEVRSVYRTAQSQFLGDSILLGSGQTIAYTNAGTSVTGVNVVKELDMTGNTDFKYYVLINVDGKVLNVRATNGTYSFSKQAVDTDHDLKIEDIDVETNNDSTLDSDITTTVCPSEEVTYTSGSGGSGSGATNIATCVTTENCTKTAVGTLLEIGGEQFYVIGTEGTNTRLLAKNAINTTSNTQVTSGETMMAFSSIGYWDGCQYSNSSGSWACAENSTSGLLSPYNNSSNAVGTTSYTTTYPFVYDKDNANADLVDAVDAYANKIGTAAGTTVTGTLMSKEEAAGLDSSIRYCGQTYWLGSAYSDRIVWIVISDGDIYSKNSYLYLTMGVRPVIIVSTSSL